MGMGTRYHVGHFIVKVLSSPPSNSTTGFVVGACGLFWRRTRAFGVGAMREGRGTTREVSEDHELWETKIPVDQSRFE